MPVAVAQKVISSSEFSDWQAYESIEYTQNITTRADYHAAMLCQMVSAGFGGKWRALEKFLLKFEPQKAPNQKLIDEVSKQTVRSIIRSCKRGNRRQSNRISDGKNRTV